MIRITHRIFESPGEISATPSYIDCKDHTAHNNCRWQQSSGMAFEVMEHHGTSFPFEVVQSLTRPPVIMW